MRPKHCLVTGILTLLKGRIIATMADFVLGSVPVVRSSGVPALMRLKITILYKEIFGSYKIGS